MYFLPMTGARALRSRACTLVEYFSVVRQDDNSTSQTCYSVKDGVNISECTLRISGMICGIPFQDAVCSLSLPAAIIWMQWPALHTLFLLHMYVK